MKLKRLVQIFIFILSVNICFTASCPSSTSDSKTINTVKERFNSFANTFTFDIALGSISNDLYIYYEAYSPYKSVIRRLDSFGNFIWMNGFEVQPLLKSLSIDSSEQKVYKGGLGNPLIVIRIRSSDGALISTKAFSGINGNSNDVKIHVLSGKDGYYVFGRDSSSRAAVCKYIFSVSTSTQCQEIPSIFLYSFGQLMLSNTQLFCEGYDKALNDFHLYKFTFGNLNAYFAKKIQCTSTSCTPSVSGSLLTLNSTSGNVIESRYKSSISCNYVDGSTINADYIAATLVCPDYFLILHLLSTATSELTINRFSGNYLYGVDVEPFSER